MSVPKIRDAFDRGDCQLTFGDHVRIRPTPDTEAAGLAGAEGQVMGETTPSTTRVRVIGSPRRDYALFVAVQSNGDEHWIDPDVLEFIDHGAGTTISLQGMPNKWIRNERGEWQESKRGFFTRLRQWLKRK